MPLRRKPRSGLPGQLWYLLVIVSLHFFVPVLFDVQLAPGNGSCRPGSRSGRPRPGQCVSRWLRAQRCTARAPQRRRGSAFGARPVCAWRESVSTEPSYGEPAHLRSPLLWWASAGAVTASTGRCVRFSVDGRTERTLATFGRMNLQTLSNPAGFEPRMSHVSNSGPVCRCVAFPHITCELAPSRKLRANRRRRPRPGHRTEL